MTTLKLSISDLEAKTGLDRRTIHFYVKEEMISRPDGAGGGAKYGEEHLLRLLLIKELQKSHLKLSGIREVLKSMSINEMRDHVQHAPGSTHVWDWHAFANWVGKVGGDSEPPAPPNKNIQSKNYSFLDLASSSSSVVNEEKQESLLGSIRRKVDFPEKRWVRFSVDDGIEVHVDEETLRKSRSKIKQWLDDFNKSEKGGKL